MIPLSQEARGGHIKHAVHRNDVQPTLVTTHTPNPVAEDKCLSPQASSNLNTTNFFSPSCMRFHTIRILCYTPFTILLPLPPPSTLHAPSTNPETTIRQTSTTPRTRRIYIFQDNPNRPSSIELPSHQDSPAYSPIPMPMKPPCRPPIFHLLWVPSRSRSSLMRAKCLQEVRDK